MMPNSFKKPLIAIFLAITFSFSHAQLTVNALKKMDQDFSFMQQSVIARLMATQKKQIDAGELTEFESRCISSNIIVMLGDENAEKFTAIAEKSYEYGIDTLSIAEIDFMTKVNEKYLPILSMVATECSEGNQLSHE